MRRHSDGCSGIFIIASFLLVLLVLARPLGTCLARMINDIPLPGLAGIERVLWRVAGIRAEEMNWLQYLLAILLFNALGGLALFALLMLQGVLPLNPQHLPGLSWDLALNTAVSFVSNTNWQAYAGETTMSYLSQMVGLTVQNFLSAATGIAVIFALTRAFARQKMSTLGNAWVDLTRITLWLLLPLSLLMACSLFSRACRRTCCLPALYHPRRGAPAAADGAGRLAGSD
jgi:K+-transporting ATPase ATPase A chain